MNFTQKKIEEFRKKSQDEFIDGCYECGESIDRDDIAEFITTALTDQQKLFEDMIDSIERPEVKYGVNQFIKEGLYLGYEQAKSDIKNKLKINN